MFISSELSLPSLIFISEFFFKHSCLVLQIVILVTVFVPSEPFPPSLIFVGSARNKQAPLCPITNLCGQTL
jgi:hypothetical protein